MDCDITSSAKISLAEAWRLFVLRKFPHIIDPQTHKPEVGGSVWITEDDRASGKRERRQLEAPKTIREIRWRVPDMAGIAFHRCIEELAGVYSPVGKGWRAIELSEWWQRCADDPAIDGPNTRALWQFVSHQPEDGGASWTTIVPRDEFPLPVFFDRSALETLEAWPIEESSTRSKILDQPKASLPIMSKAEIRAFIVNKEKELGRRPPIRGIESFPDLRNRGVTDSKYRAEWRVLYPSPTRGRPAIEKNVLE